VREVVVLDTDTLSELSRGNAIVQRRARDYLNSFGRLTITAITLFERLRGYRAAIRDGKPYEKQLAAFEALATNCVVLPFDEDAAAIAAVIRSAVSRNHRQKLGDILIASVAVARQVPLVTRNLRDFETFAKVSGVALRLDDWTKTARFARR
jgi:predicted nucleic acid-binding protein